MPELLLRSLSDGGRNGSSAVEQTQKDSEGDIFCGFEAVGMVVSSHLSSINMLGAGLRQENWLAF